MYNSQFLLICLLTISIVSESLQYFTSNSINYLFGKINDASASEKKELSDFAIEDAHLNITQLVTKYGYKIEAHTVTTEDGYILNVHRMPARNSTNNVIFLMHGILDSSDSWVLQGPKYALAYFLVNEGFDVWMGNARGNKYSFLHTKLNNTQADFWKFTWEEIGIHDLPAMIDYVLNVTGIENMHYVGYSQGTTTFYVMNSMKPEYNKKIKSMFSLAPVAWMSHAKSPIIKLFTPTYEIFGFFLNVDIYGSSTDYLNKIRNFFCNTLPFGCESLLQSIIGNDNKLVKPSFMPVISGHVPTSSSSLQIIHYAQLYSSGKFCRFDFGASENLLKYGQREPPDYDLSNVTVPIVLFYSTNDYLSDVVDVSLLFTALPHVYNTYYMENFNHYDYLYANAAKDLIYANIVKEIRDFELNYN